MILDHPVHVTPNHQEPGANQPSQNDLHAQQQHHHHIVDYVSPVKPATYYPPTAAGQYYASPMKMTDGYGLLYF